MTRGQRNFTVTKATLVERLQKHGQPQFTVSVDAPLKQLLGHAIYYGEVCDKEIEETTPRCDTVIPCYLYPYVTDVSYRHIIDKYVEFASQAFRRGTIILNAIAQRLCGSRHPGAGDVSVAVWRPRFEDGPVLQGMRGFVDLWQGDQIEDCCLKHAFMPERWTPDVRDPNVNAIINNNMIAFAEDVPPELEGWRSVMIDGFVSGWDNAINRMIGKYFGNVKVQVMKGLKKSIHEYLKVVPLVGDFSMRNLLIDSVITRPRPLIVHDSDYQMAMNLRSPMIKSFEFFMPNDAPWSMDAFLVYVFLARFGVKECSYLPVASPGRHYCYIDSKIAGNLFPSVHAKLKVHTATTRLAKANQRAPPITPSLGELMGLTPEMFNAKRKVIARRARNQCKERSQAQNTNPAQRVRLKKIAKRRNNVGSGSMRRGVRMDSFETDSVGLRMCLKSSEDMKPFIVPITADVVKAKAVAPKPMKGKKKVSKKQARINAMNAEEPQPVDPTLIDPIGVGVDEGRAKLFTAVVWPDAAKKPQTIVLTRRKYNAVTKLKIRTSWEKQRVNASPGLRQAHDALSTGSLRSCDTDAWSRYMAAEHAHRAVLHADYYVDKERELWRMRAFRKKRSCLDRAVGSIIAAATKGQPKSRPLVIGIGDAAFPPNGPRGEIAVPTSKLASAYKRAFDRERRKGRRVAAFPISECYTTKGCCACGAETTPPTVRKRWKTKKGVSKSADGPSWRLRCCTSCTPNGKLRDRDVQAARNMLWATMAMIRGEERPAHLCHAFYQRDVVVVDENVNQAMDVNG